MTDVRARAAETEAKARTTFCPSCRSAIGEACLTGSGSPRGIAHEARKALAGRMAHAG